MLNNLSGNWKFSNTCCHGDNFFTNIGISKQYKKIANYLDKDDNFWYDLASPVSDSVCG